MQTTFKLYKSLILETVKNETHIAAHVARATDKAAAELAYHEEAGDEAFHVRKLERALFASIDKIKAEIIGYLDTNASTVNIKSEINNDEITFTVVLSDRFNAAYLTPLADLVSKFIEDNMLFLWWTPINVNTANNYAQHVELDRQQVLKCFIKNAPNASDKDYSQVTGSNGNVSGSSYATAVAFDTSVVIDNEVTFANVGDTVVVPYTTTPSNAYDDFIATSSQPTVYKVDKLSGKLAVTKISNDGEDALITIASLHDLSVSKSFTAS